MDVDTGWYSPYVAQPNDVAWFRWEGCDETWAQWKVLVRRRRRYLSRACTRMASYMHILYASHMRSECLRTYTYKDFIIILFFRIHAIN
jgi:hypothetical protein